MDPVALSPWGSPFFKYIEKNEKTFASVPDFIHSAIFEAYIQTAVYQNLDRDTIDGIIAPSSSEQGKAAF